MAEDDGPSQDGGAAKLFSAAGFVYAFAVTVALLPIHDFFRDDPNQDTVLIWLLVPLVASLGTWLAVHSALPPLRASIWLGILPTLFFCWIAIFSIGLLYLPVAVLMMVAAVTPWDRRTEG
jgi:hypothetical protein